MVNYFDDEFKKASILFYTLVVCLISCNSGMKSAGDKYLNHSVVTREKYKNDSLPWMKYRHVVHPDTLAILDSYLGNVKYESRHNEIDVRAKMIYVKTDKVRTAICMNSNDIMINGRLIKQDEQFIAFLKRLTPYK